MHDDLYVCANCFEDEGLQDFVRSVASATECSFCRAVSEEPIAAHLPEVTEHMLDCLSEYYDDAANNLPYESAEGGYQGAHWDTYDLLMDELAIGLPRDRDGALFDRILAGLGDQTWCEAEPFALSPEDQLRLSWEEFCRVVKHQRRFFFQSERRAESELLEPGTMLATISDYAQTIGRVRRFKAGSRLYRARYQRPDETLRTARELGPPPLTRATMANRMSPPGIVMFYVSDDPDTALRETVAGPADFVIAEFEITREIRVLDLVGLPPVPSIFHPIPDSSAINPRRVLIFLHQIAREISKRIARDDRAHVEYVPTQVVTEYFRTVVLECGNRLDGIRFTSVRNPPRSSFVLFADQDNLVLSEDALPDPVETDRWIRLVRSRPTVVTKELLATWRDAS